MKFNKILLFLFVILSPLAAVSQTYVGFELCKKTSIENITKILEKSGATNIKITIEEKHLYTSVEAEQYPVANGFAKISLSITENILFGIYLKDDSNAIEFVQIMSDKYGVLGEFTGILGEPNYQFKSKDPRISISGKRGSATYSCDSINERRFNKVKKEERKGHKGNLL